jgi:hypothetical protein
VRSVFNLRLLILILGKPKKPTEESHETEQLISGTLDSSYPRSQ